MSPARVERVRLREPPKPIATLAVALVRFGADVFGQAGVNKFLVGVPYGAADEFAAVKPLLGDKGKQGLIIKLGHRWFLDEVSEVAP